MKNRQKDIAMRALMNEAIPAYSDGKHEQAHVSAIEVMDTYVFDEDFDASDQDVIGMLRKIFEAAHDYARALEVNRRQAQLIGIAPYTLGHAYFRCLEASKSGARLGDFVPGATPDQLGKTLLIACIPKTGSTFMQATLAAATGYDSHKLCLSYADEENTLYPGYIKSIGGNNKIAQEHVRASAHNLAVIQAMDAAVVVLVRNIFDSLVSMRDMLVGYGGGSVVALFQDNLRELDNENQMDAIMNKWALWQIEFFVSWVRAMRAERVKARLMTYEELMIDKAAAIEDVCCWFGHDVEAEKAREAVELINGDAIASRLNVGVSGRGLEHMNARQIDWVQSLTRFYPDVNFGPLGLD